MNFCIPADFSFDTIKLINELEKKYPNHKVEEVYGNISPSPILGSGRGRNVGESQISSLNGLKSYIKVLDNQNIAFNYTLNVSCTENIELNQYSLESIIEFIHNLEKRVLKG